MMMLKKLMLGAALAVMALIPGQAMARHGHGGGYGGGYGYYEGHRSNHGYRHNGRKYVRHYRNNYRDHYRPRVRVYQSYGYGYAPRYDDGYYGYRSNNSYRGRDRDYDDGYRGHRHSRRCDHDDDY
jgi:hypothetical protein